MKQKKKLRFPKIFTRERVKIVKIYILIVYLEVLRSKLKINAAIFS